MRSAYLFLLICASLCSARPIQIQESLIQHQQVLVNLEHDSTQPYKLQGSNIREPALRKYLSSYQETESLVISSPLKKTEKGPKCFLDRYGSFVGKYFTPRHHNTTSSQTVIIYTHTASIFDMFSRHGPECVMLSIFVLFPIAYCLLELLELAYRCCTRKQNKEQEDMYRSTAGVCLLGPEKQLRVWSNKQLEVLEMVTEKMEKDDCQT
ncbi:hypothetical protein N7495_009575 [Penicillium taxi]|uniref:uncharacterized protein n=1 Tax=Penicillium taxi TaxID=168475 RepID=UPI002545A453|nr:uncharacterized protein N7495_009575 [Penicillium taxi]KAJ5885065.1 hypothetical protein N7495_009575 [Penicillium taxi]